jgi:hypothetical protein
MNMFHTLHRNTLSNPTLLYCGSHPVSYSLAAWGSFPGETEQLEHETDLPYLVMGLSMHESSCLCLHEPTWCAARALSHSAHTACAVCADK